MIALLALVACDTDPSTLSEVFDGALHKGLHDDRRQGVSLSADAGKRLEPALVATFADLVGRYPVGTVVLLQTGEVAVVYSPPESDDHDLRPVVRLLTAPSGGKFREEALVDLRDRTPAGVYLRTIVRSLDASMLGIDVLQALFGPT